MNKTLEQFKEEKIKELLEIMPLGLMYKSVKSILDDSIDQAFELGVNSIKPLQDSILETRSYNKALEDVDILLKKHLICGPNKIEGCVESLLGEVFSLKK